MKAWRVVANHWKENQGWTYEEDVEEIYDYIDAEGYVNSLDDDTLAAYFGDHEDAVQFDILDEDGNKVSDFWVDRTDAVDHWTLVRVGGENDGEEFAVTEDENNAYIMAREYSAKHEDEPDFLGVMILDRHGDEVLNWQERRTAMRYRNTNTGEVFPLSAIQNAYDMFRYDMETDYGCFDNWFDKMCQNGEYEEVDEPDLLGNRELIQKLYDHIGHDMGGVENDIKFDFLTQNEGRDGKQYLWYMDSGMMAIIDEDGNISEDHDKIDELFC